MPMTRSAFPKELKPGLHALFGVEYDRWPDQWKEIFEINQATMAVEEEQGLSGFGYAAIKAEGGPTAMDEAYETYTARYPIFTVSLGFSLTEEAMEDNLYMSLSRRYVKALARSMKETKNLYGANILNNAFSSSFVGGDGVELCATNHPSAAGNQSNELATPAQLSETSYEDLVNQVARAKDWRGLPCKLNPVGLVVPRGYLMQTAARVAMSPLRPGTGDNDINANRELGLVDKIIGITDMTSATNWFIKTDCPEGMKYMEKVKLGTKDWTDGATGNLAFRSRERYCFGWSDYRSLFGSAAT